MKLGLKYAAHAWSYYGIALAVSLVFLGGMGSTWYALALNALLILGMMGLAGYMEYYVQRHGNEAAFAYSIMSASLLLVILLVLITWALGKKRTVQA